jgi:GNAT superfamily N-acetyltransferase
MDARNYSALETLRDGSVAEIRAQRPGDRQGMRSALRRMSDRTIMRRFFSPRPHFSEQQVASFIDVDFEKHVALVAILPVEGQPLIVGGGRYIVTEPGSAEVAFAIDDANQHRGLGSVLMKHLILIAREKGLRQFVAEMLPENTAMLGLLRKSGLEVTTQREHGLIRGRMQLHSSTSSLAEHHD